MFNTFRLALGITLLAAIGLGAAAGSALDEKTVTVVAKDDNGKVELAKGDKLLVKLRESPSTGFTWFIASKASDKLKTDGKPKFESDDKDSQFAGQPGTVIFTFTAAQAGEVEVEFHLKRTLDKDKEPQAKYKLKVTIK